MAKKKTNTVDYFPHPVKNGTRMYVMEQKYGDKGYCCYYKLLEMLGAAENHTLDFRGMKDLLYFAASLRATEIETMEMLGTLAELGSIDKTLWLEKRIVWCQQFVDNVEHLYLTKRHREPPSRSNIVELFNTETDKSEDFISHSIVKKSKEEKSKEEKSAFAPLISKIIDSLNFVSSSSYRHDSVLTIKCITARLRENYKFEDFEKVIIHKQADWYGKEEYKYMRPETLFGNKFEGYLQYALRETKESIISESEKIKQRILKKIKDELTNTGN